MYSGQARYWTSAVIGSIPVVGEFYRAYQNYSYYDDYLRNSGMTWDDVKYPGRVASGGFGGTMNYVSSNIKRLYR